MESRAAVITTFNEPLELWNVPIPELAPGSALMRVDAATLCGTDAHRWQGHLRDMDGILPFVGRMDVPFVPGHETCGTIVEMRGDLRDITDVPLRIGDRVIVSYPSCGHCYYCKVAQQPTLCSQLVSYGHSHPNELLGGCAEYHVIPAGVSYIRVPDTVVPALAASAACALRTVMHGYELLGGIAPHETVLVLGVGPLGLYSLAVARDSNAAKVIAIGGPEARLEVARRFGTDAALNFDAVPSLDDRIAWVKEQTGGRGADVVFQCASGAAIPEAFAMVRHGGRIVNIGITGGPPIGITPLSFFRGISLATVVMAEARHFYQAISFLDRRSSAFPFEAMISNTYPLEKASDAIRAMAEFREVKPLILAHGAA